MGLRVADRANVSSGLPNTDAIILHKPAVTAPQLRQSRALWPPQPPLRWRYGKRACAEERINAETQRLMEVATEEVWMFLRMEEYWAGSVEPFDRC